MHIYTAGFATALLACCGVFAQNTQSASSSYRPGIDFSKYHTYKWVAIQDRQHPDPAKDAQIKQLIDSQLMAKGLTQRDDTSGLLVDYQVSLTKEETWKTYHEFELWDVPQREKVIIEVGTLVVDMYDPATKKLVWTGRAKKTVDPNGSAKRMRTSVEKAVQALLKHFPPN